MKRRLLSTHRFAETSRRVLGFGNPRQSIGFFLEPGLFGIVKAFAPEATEEMPAVKDTYAESLLETLRRTGRA